MTFLDDRYLHEEFFLALHFCSCLVTSNQIFALKNYFLTWSQHFNGTMLGKCSLTLSLKNVCIISKCWDHVRRYEYFKFVSWAFHGVIAPKKSVLVNLTKIKRLEGESLKNLSKQIYHQIFDTNPSIYDTKTN